MTIKKEDTKKIVDILKNLCILQDGYTGKIILHFSQGSVNGIQYDYMLSTK